VNEKMRDVVIEDEQDMSLLGLILAALLTRRLARRATKLRGDVSVDASGMRVTLRFDDRGVRVSRAAPAGRTVVRIRGTMRALCDAALGRRRVRSVLAGKLTIIGRPLAIIRLVSLLTAGGSS
jgi:hypothetical protein